jgi:hypothetical protein
MNYQGDITLGDTLDVKFTTVNSSGVPTTLAGSPAVAAYVDNSTTEITAGITLTVDFDARTGLHNVRVVATSGNGYAAGTNINLVITAGTVSGNSVVGYVIGSLSIDKRAVNVAKWAGSATATGNIAIKNTLAHGTDITGTPADSAGVTTLLSRVTSTIFTGITSLKEWLGMLAGKQVGNTTARTEIRSSGAGSGTFDETTDSQEAVRDRGDAAWITGSGGDPWATAIPGAYSAGTAGNILGNRLDAAVTTRLAPTTAGRTLDVTTTGEAGIDWNNIGAPTTTQNLSGTTISASQAVASVSGAVGSVTAPVTVGTNNDKTGYSLTAAYDAAKVAASQSSVDTLAGYVDTEVAAIKAKTDQLTFTAGKVDANAAVTAGDLTAIADAILKRDWTAVSGEAAYSLLNAARMLRNAWATPAGVLTVKKEDGSTTAWTRTLSTDPAAQPIVGAT